MTKHNSTAGVAAPVEADGPVMQRGTKGDGTPWMGTMRECLEDAREAARVESQLGDEARAEVKRLRALLGNAGVRASDDTPNGPQSPLEQKEGPA